jgi:hypothetical protein
MFKVEFETDNAAFDDCKEFEIKRILEKLIKDIFYNESGKIYDKNGNKIGSWKLE